MPRRPTSEEAIQVARQFLSTFIRQTDSQDHILPKNDLFSPFMGFCRIYGEYAKKKDGGTSTDGVSRAAFNKICLEYFEEGMRKPARNGNPGALVSNLAQQRRHFLRGRWLDPADSEDDEILQSLLARMTPEQAAAAVELLRDFSRWKPGPAGRGGERLCKKRSASWSGESGEDESECESHASSGLSQPSSKRRAIVSEEPCTTPRLRVASAGGMTKKSAEDSNTGAASASGGDASLLELLCMVASRVEAERVTSSPSNSSETDSIASEASTSSCSLSSDSQEEAPQPVHKEPAHQEAVSHVTSKREVTHLDSDDEDMAGNSCQIPAKNPTVDGPVVEGGAFSLRHTIKQEVDEEENKSHALCGQAKAMCDASSPVTVPTTFASALQSHSLCGGASSLCHAIRTADEESSTSSTSPSEQAHNNKDKDLVDDSTPVAPTYSSTSSMPSAVQGVPAPFASLFRPDVASGSGVVDEGMSRFPLHALMGKVGGPNHAS